MAARDGSERTISFTEKYSNISIWQTLSDAMNRNICLCGMQIIKVFSIRLYRKWFGVSRFDAII